MTETPDKPIRDNGERAEESRERIDEAKKAAREVAKTHPDLVPDADPPAQRPT
ncbi:hypothetical protein [Actinokineospora iranica]|uniref:Uncharacterized protein n=1 Tax=Actinokineospora iranica TaxID=1271860 RepID=A0A1G6TDP7_9PSEU|nr:hypothetical protein [Actinokineospora iranica]SDD27191.1 hypothetical protein SAMN05216174_10996 [Actinokineospora iranica]